MVIAMSHRLIPFLIALLGVLVVSVPTAAVSGWSAPVQIYDGNYSEPSLAVDAHGFAHVVARGDTGIWYLTNRSGSWTRERLTTDYVQDGIQYRAIAPLITIDRSVGKLVVVYGLLADVECLPGCPPTLEYITRTGSNWSAARSIPTSPSCCGPLSIAARGGDIAIAGLDDRVTPRNGETLRIVYLHKADGWSVHRVAGGGNASSFGPPSLALDRAGRPRIAFQRNDHMKFAKGATTSGTFTIETVATVSGARPSLALDPQDRPMIVWAAGDGTHFARRAGDWSSALVMPGRFDARLVVDGDGAHVVSSDGHKGLWYGTGTTSANWTSQQVADARVKVLGGIGVAPNGRVDIAYQTGQDSPRVWFTHTTN
jgi:hypothetical protein